MAAAATDLVRKKKSNFSTTLSSSIDDTTSTVPISSKSGLPTDTAVTLTVDRVDANGNSTPTKMERFTGIVNGSSNQIDDAIRGDEGTAQSHAAGAIVEDIWEAATWNDICTAFLVSHTQAGNIKSGAQIDDVNQSFQYQLSASVLSADRVVALPALNSADTFVFEKHTQSLENKTLITPVINSWGTFQMVQSADTPAAPSAGFLKLYAKTNGKLYRVMNGGSETDIAITNLPDSTLINGKIVPSVTSNNLTVALKTLSGADPSANDPVYIVIGDTIRTVTAALSVTKNAGTNWCNAGGAELATKEIDYFVYLGYNATDGVTIVFSRLPFGRIYSDFSATSTNERYAAISTITNAAAGDNYVNIGRFAATLSAGAGYTWTVPTFTSINLIQKPIFETRILTWTPVFTGFSTPPTWTARYQIIGRQVFYTVYSTGNGTSNANNFRFTVPLASSASAANTLTQIGALVDNSTLSTTRDYAELAANSSTVNLTKNNATTGFTTSANKTAYLQMFYEI